MSHNPGNKTFPFSATAIDALPPAAAGRRDEYCDTRCPGLVLRVTSTGAKSFSVVTWNPKRKTPERKALGFWPKVALDEVRRRARIAAHFRAARGARILIPTTFVASIMSTGFTQVLPGRPGCLPG